MGASWKLLTKEQVNAIVFDPEHPGSMYMAMEYQGLSRGSDTGEKIKMLNHGFVDRTIASVTRAGDKLIALETQLGESSGIFISGNNGESWSQLEEVRGLNGVHLKTIAAMPREDRILLAAAPHQMYKSIDAGLLWKPLPFRLIVPSTEPVKPPVSRAASKSARKTVARKPVEKLRDVYPDEIHGLYTVKNGTKDLVFAATNLGLLMSADTGERWTMAEVAGSSPVTGLYFSPTSDGRIVARADAGLFLSKDYGEHWVSLNSPTPPSDVKDVALAADAAAPILVATRLGLFASIDEGNKWAANPGGMPASTVNSVVYGSGTLAYAVQYGKLWESKDAGNSWTPLYSALPTTRIRQLWIPDLATNRVFGVTSDLGVLFRN
jgi:photosystem II stability/assembly factor-like uncharacterized protein